MSEKAVLNKIQTKKAAKDFLRNECGLALNKKKLLLSIFIDEESSGKDVCFFLENLLEAVKAISISVVIVAPGNVTGKLLRYKNPRGVFVLKAEDENVRQRILIASDVSFVFPLSEMKITDLQKMWANGVVPITSEKQFQTEDYNPNRETGTSFYVQHGDIWNVFAALVRAHETYRFPYDWKHIVRQAIQTKKR